MSGKINKVKFNNALLLVALYIILFFCFTFVIQGFWEFIKVKYVYSIDYIKLTIGVICILCNISLLTFLRLNDFLYSIAALILIFFVFPSAILYTHIQGIDVRIFVSHSLFFLSVLLAGKLRIKIKSKKIELMQSKRVLFIIAFIGLIPYVFLFLPYLNFKNLLLIDIYETRALMGEQISNVYVNYAYSSFNKFIIPCLLVFGIFFRERLTILFCSLSLIFLFLCGAHKAVFMGLIITLFLYKYDYLKKINYFIKILIGISACALIVSLVFKDDFLMVMSVRRVMLLPALVDTLYFDLFDNNHLYWSEIVNGLFRDYPYNDSHAFVIGDKYFGYPEWGANNGIVSDGFMNFGMIGIAINILIVSLYISILSQLNISPRFFGLFFLFIFLILSASLTTILLTHGGIVLMLLAFFFMKNTNEQMQ